MKRIVFTLACLFASSLFASTVTLTAASINATVSTDASTVGGGPSKHAENNDVGDLTKRSVTASAAASLPFSGVDFPVSRAQSTGSYTLSNNDRIDFSGAVDTTVYVKSSPFTGKGSADLTTDLLFNVIGGGLYQIGYQATMSALMSTTTALSADLTTAAGDPVFRFNQPAGTTQQLYSGGQNFFLAPGDYRLKVVASANADAGLGAGDSASIQYQVNLNPAQTAVVPLPPAAWSGVATIALISIAGMRSGCSGLLPKALRRSSRA
ncbi:MAG TPA: hypothetical protein VF669_15340 [Tepidisphaeraceae bacterium]|jgi:hypothetical protein